VGFAAYKYQAGFGIIPSLHEAFRPVSTAFEIVPNTPDVTDGNFTYSHSVVDCQNQCRHVKTSTGRNIFDPLEDDENYVAVSIPARSFRRSRERLNIADTILGP
jgi:hypothetical protein